MDKLAEYNMTDIQFAFAHPEAKQVIQEEIAQNNIRMVGKNNETLFKRQMTKIGEKGERAANESPDGTFIQFKDDEEDIDPLEAELDANERALENVAETVKNIARKNSLRRQESGATPTGF